MESIPMNYSGDYNHRVGIPRRNFNINRPLASYSSDDLALACFLAGGSFGGGGGGLPFVLPPPLSRSYPPAISGVRPLEHHRLRHQQPPLLPLPISTPPIRHNMNYNSNRLSSPPINKKVKNNRPRDQSLTPKKSKNQKKDSNKQKGDLLPPTSSEAAAPKKSPAINRIGPDPKDLPNGFISRALSAPANDFSDVISGSVVFTASPPPSSLPLPTFSLRRKVGCCDNTGATNDLRQPLRLR